MLFTVHSATDGLDVGLVGLTDGGSTGVLSFDLDHLFVLVTLGNLTMSVDEGFSLNGTLLGDAGVSSSDFVGSASDLSTGSVDELESGSAWLSNT